MSKCIPQSVSEEAVTRVQEIISLQGEINQTDINENGIKDICEEEQVEPFSSPSPSPIIEPTPVTTPIITPIDSELTTSCNELNNISNLSDTSNLNLDFFFDTGLEKIYVYKLE
jgi:hypothetical protein